MQTPAGQYSEALYRAAIGPKNTEFYVSKFQRFDQPGSSKLSWNWPAFFFAIGWLPYRRMFLEWGLYCLVIPLAVLVAARIASAVVGSRAADFIEDAADLAYAFIVIPLYANAIYWRAVRRRINSLQRQVEAPANQMAILEKGPHTSALWWIPVALVGIGIAGFFAALAIPSYQDKVIRAQVMEGLQLSYPVRAAIMEYYTEHHDWPSNLAELGLPSVIHGRHVSDLAIDHGSVTIHYGLAAHPLIANQSLSMRPTLTEQAGIRWVCGYDTYPANDPVGGTSGANQTSVAERYLPPECRHAQAPTNP